MSTLDAEHRQRSIAAARSSADLAHDWCFLVRWACRPVLGVLRAVAPVGGVGQLAGCALDGGSAGGGPGDLAGSGPGYVRAGPSPRSAASLESRCAASASAAVLLVL